jgi:hypothetical protein
MHKLMASYEPQVRLPSSIVPARPVIYIIKHNKSHTCRGTEEQRNDRTFEADDSSFLAEGHQK